MDKSIEQLGQDLALAKYAKTTCKKYLRTPCTSPVLSG